MCLKFRPACYKASNLLSYAKLFSPPPLSEEAIVRKMGGGGGHTFSSPLKLGGKRRKMAKFLHMLDKRERFSL